MRAQRVPFTAWLLALGLMVPARGVLATQPTRLLWQAQGVENVLSIAWIEDVDGDAVPDVLFESYDAGPSGVDHLFAISGASSGTGTVIWSARPLGGPSNSGGYGDYCLQTSPDLTGDGKSDVLYGSAWGGRTAFALDGLTGSTFWSFDTYSDSPPTPPQSGWVYAVASLGSDLTSDGVPEVLFCAGSDNHCVYCADGRTGAILWYYRGLDAFDFVASIADVDQDGIRDVVAAQTDNYPRVHVFSGRGGVGGAARLIWGQDLTNAIWSCCEIPQPGGIPATLVVGCWDNKIHGYNAANGSPRWAETVGYSVQRVVAIPDVNGDGIMDVAVGSWDNAGRVHSGSNGALIWRTPVGTVNGGDCWACDPVGDTNGDGVEEVAFGSFDLNAYLMDGRTGAILWSYYVGDRVLTIRGLPDLTGNRIPDVAAGTQMQYGAPHGGVCYALEGNDNISPADVADPRHQAPGLQVGPNPSRGPVSWSFSLELPAATALLEVFDSGGRRVRVLHRGPATAGLTRAQWDGSDEDGRALPAGVYLGRLAVDGHAVATLRQVRLP